MRVCQSTDWFESWVVQAAVLDTGSLDLDKLDLGRHIGRTTDLLCSCTKHLDNKLVPSDPRGDAGTEKEGTVPCRPGILHSCRNSRHTPGPVVEQVRNHGCCLQQKAAEEVLSELVGRHPEVPVLGAQGGKRRQ